METQERHCRGAGKVGEVKEVKEIATSRLQAPSTARAESRVVEGMLRIETCEI